MIKNMKFSEKEKNNKTTVCRGMCFTPVLVNLECRLYFICAFMARHLLTLAVSCIKNVLPLALSQGVVSTKVFFPVIIVLRLQSCFL